MAKKEANRMGGTVVRCSASPEQEGVFAGLGSSREGSSGRGEERKNGGKSKLDSSRTKQESRRIMGNCAWANPKETSAAVLGAQT